MSGVVVVVDEDDGDDDAKSHSARTLWVGVAVSASAREPRQRWIRCRCGAWLSGFKVKNTRRERIFLSKWIDLITW